MRHRTRPIGLVALAVSIALLASACGLSFGSERSQPLVSSTIEPTPTTQSAQTTVSEPAATDESATTSSTPPAPSSSTTSPPASTTTSPPEPALLPIPDPVTEPPETAGPWGDVVVSVESFWDEEFAAFAGSGSFAPPDRDRIVSVTDDTRSGDLPDCDRVDGLRRTVENNAVAASCQEGHLVLWDEDDLFVDLAQQFGDTGPAIVIAHEFGHVAQFQARVRTAPVIIEQQADCLAGAYAAWANERGIAPFDTPESLDAAVGATVSFRDNPGSSANSASAHGSGFDRVRAYQDGFDRGVSFCAGYPDTPPPITEFPFAPEERETGGNLPFNELVDLLVPYFDTFFGTHIEGWQSFQPTPAELQSTAQLREHVFVGDNSTGTRLAMQYTRLAQEVLGLETDTEGALLQQACGAGATFNPLFFGGDDAPEIGRLSPGDLDEAVITLTRIVEQDGDLPSGFLFELVASLRVGFTDGIDTCALF